MELVETFEDKRYYFLVMELCEGGELMLRILKHQHFSEKTASGYFRQMLLGVKHCHENLVVHRYVATTHNITQLTQPDPF